MQALLKVIYSLALIIFWFSLEFFCRHSLRFSAPKHIVDDTKNRLVSLIHILGCVFLSSVLLLTQPDINT